MSRMRQFSGVSDDIYDSKPFSSANSRERTAIATAAAAVSAFERLMSQHKDLSDRFSFHMLQLQKTFKEAETLRQENTNLRVANCELNHQISLLLEAAASYSEERVDNALTESPTSVIEQKGEEEEGRISLPKSISVRSKEYLRTSPVGTLTCVSATSASGSEGKSKPKRGGSSKTRVLSPVSGPQKVYMRGGSNKDGPIELDVFNQGMFKTELCNKWQETGECPYGDNCQFAHGMKELRPVIRHPRYKTEVCRMVLAGDPCPYGHRCHFRHALTQEEQLMLPPRLE